MEFLEQYWPALTGATVVPAMKWLKAKAEIDWPILWAAVMIAMNALLAFGVNYLFGLGLTLPEMWPYISGGILMSVLGHSTWKTGDKKLLK